MENLSIVEIFDIAGNVSASSVLIWFVWAFMTGRIRSKQTEDEQMAVIGDVVEKAVRAGNADMKEAIGSLNTAIRSLHGGRDSRGIF